MRTVLIVDDNSVNRFCLRGLLGSSYQIFEAVDGVDGVEKAIEIRPDLILLDILMPRLDGFDVATILKQNASTRHIPIIFISAVIDPESRDKAFHLGAADFITKPFNGPMLKSRISAQFHH